MPPWVWGQKTTSWSHFSVLTFTWALGDWTLVTRPKWQVSVFLYLVSYLTRPKLSTFWLFSILFNLLLLLYVYLVIWIRMTPIGSYIWMLHHHRVALFERTRWIKKCGLRWRKYVTGGGLWEVSKAPAKPRVSLSVDQKVTLSYCSRACLRATMLPAVMIMDWSSETSSKLPVKYSHMGWLGHGFSSLYSYSCVHVNKGMYMTQHVWDQLWGSKL